MVTDPSRRRFKELVLPHLDEALTYAHWLVRNRTDAEDVTHEAFVRALEGMEGLRGAAPRAWLFAIVRNVAFTWLRRNRRADLVFTDDHALHAETEDGSLQSTPEAALIRKQTAERIEAAIADLPIVFREAVILRDVHNMSYREIGLTLGIPAGSVMSRLARGRARLAASLAEDAA